VRSTGSFNIVRCRTSTLRAARPVASSALRGINARGAIVAASADDSPGSFCSAPTTVNSVVAELHLIANLHIKLPEQRLLDDHDIAAGAKFFAGASAGNVVKSP
jgi:hypothetical protein